MKAMILLLSILFTQPAFASRSMTDAEVKKAIIQDSIAAYSGNCPCPYHVARNGSRCGGRSAYSRAGGASVICFDTDVTQQMIDLYRESRK